jgi:putative ABC transport system permease protein
MVTSFKYAIRQLLHDKHNTVIQIIGLVIGIASCMLIMQYVLFEHSYDRFNDDAPLKYRTRRTAPMALGPKANDELAYVVNYARLHPVYRDAIITHNDDSYLERNLFFADSSIFSILSFPILEGDARAALSTRDHLVISERYAKKYFGEKSPIGQTLVVNCSYENNRHYTVGAVFKDIPNNSHVKFDILLSIENILVNRMYSEDSPWRWSNFFTYFKITEKGFEDNLQRDLNRIAFESGGQSSRDEPPEYPVSQITQLHLDGMDSYMGNNMSAGNIYVWGFVALIILAIAWLNAINLSIATAYRTRNIMGIKKVVGASRGMLWGEHFSKSLLINLTALFISINVMALFSQVSERLTGLTTSLPQGYHLVFWGAITLLLIAGVLISTIVPALFHTKQSALQLIQRQVPYNKWRYSPITFMVIAQFIASIILICFAIISTKQINDVMEINTGIEMEQVLAIHSARVSKGSVGDDRRLFEEEVLSISGVESASSALYIPGMFIPSYMVTQLQGDLSNKEIPTRMNFVGYNYIELFNHQILAGRNFSINHATDPTAVVINSKLAEMYGFDNPDYAIGKTILWPIRNTLKTIVGVVDSYMQQSADKKVEPTMFHLWENASGFCLVAINSSNTSECLEYIRNKWDEVHPGNPFDYIWVDAFYNSQFIRWQQFSRMSTFFSSIAIFIACIGLIGLTSLMLTSRTKEIGIRKVNGAKIWQVMLMLNMDFVKWVAIAFVIATPIAYYAMDKWLQNFAYRTQLSWWVFALAGLLALVIALLTVSWQSWLAARRNPVEALRYE